MYFEEYKPKTVGAPCRDGGLQENNPVQVAVNEADRRWGEVTPIDMVLSIGSGQASQKGKIQGPPSSWWIIPDWVQDLLKNMLDNMNGQKSWNSFCKNSPRGRKARAHRLNLVFSDSNEPELDAVDKVSDLAEQARSFIFRPPQGHSQGFAVHPTSEDKTSDRLVTIALSLRASLFYFHMKQVKHHDNDRLITFSGEIHCRLLANTDPFRLLLTKTRGIKTGNEPPIPIGMDTTVPLRLSVEITVDLMQWDRQICIDVEFAEEDGLFPISGFPCPMKVSNCLFACLICRIRTDDSIGKDLKYSWDTSDND